MSDSESGSEDDGIQTMGDKNKKYSSMQKHRGIVADILTSAKNGKMSRLRGQLADYVLLINNSTTKEKEREEAAKAREAALKAKYTALKAKNAARAECAAKGELEGATVTAAELALAEAEAEAAALAELEEATAEAAVAEAEAAAAAAEEEGEEEEEEDEEVTLVSLIESIKDGPGRTMVHFAASRGHGKTVSWLCATCPGAANMLDNEGASPLALAAARGSEPACVALLEAGAAVDTPDKTGARALHHACGEGFPAVVALLAGAGADLEGQSGAGAPLHWAAGARRSEVVATLLELGAAPDAKNEGGLTPLLLAAASGDGASAAALARAGADVGFVLQGGLTVLHIVADLGLPTAVEAILETATGAKCAATLSDDGLKPIQLAAANHAGAEEGAAGESARVRATACVTLLAPLSALPAGTTAVSLLATAAETAAAAEAAGASGGGDGAAKEVALDGDGLPVDAREAEVPSAEDIAAAELAKERGNALMSVKKKKRQADPRDYPAAIAAYTDALRLHPRAERTWANRSAAKLAAGDAAGAAADALNATRLDAKYAKGWFRLGKARMALHAFEDAAMAYWEGMRAEGEGTSGAFAMKKLMQEAVVEGRKATHGDDVKTVLEGGSQEV